MLAGRDRGGCIRADVARPIALGRRQGPGRMPSAMTDARHLTIAARDGYPLAATVYGPREPRRVVVISSATAVPRRFYRHFAGALAEAGLGVLTYDYRGIGGSRPKSLRGFDARMRDWALLDMAAVVDWVRAEHPGVAISMVGHSVGGQVAGLIDNADAIDGMLTFSAQSGHWRLQGGEQKALVALHMHVTFPVLAQAVGYMPWSKLGAGEDLPKGVALEWARWCRSPGYLLDDHTLPLQRYRAFEAPVLAYSFADDKWGSRRAVDAMMCNAYPNVSRRHVSPGDAGLRSIGHFGLFRPGAAHLWPELIDWLHAPSN